MYRNTKLQDECLLFQQSLFPLQNINIFGLSWLDSVDGGVDDFICPALPFSILLYAFYGTANNITTRPAESQPRREFDSERYGKGCT